MVPVLTISRETFLRRVDEARATKGWSDLRTCREAGIGDTWLKDYRRRPGAKRPGAAIVARLAAALEIPAAWLVEERPEGLQMTRQLDERRLEDARRIAKEVYDLCRQKFPNQKIAEFAEQDCVDLVYDVLTESAEAGIRTTRRNGNIIALTIRRLLISRLLGELPK